MSDTPRIDIKSGSNGRAPSKLYDSSQDGDLQGRWWCGIYGKGWWVSQFYGV